MIPFNVTLANRGISFGAESLTKTESGTIPIIMRVSKFHVMHREFGHTHPVKVLFVDGTTNDYTLEGVPYNKTTGNLQMLPDTETIHILDNGNSIEQLRSKDFPTLGICKEHGVLAILRITRERNGEYTVKNITKELQRD